MRDISLFRRKDRPPQNEPEADVKHEAILEFMDTQQGSDLNRIYEIIKSQKPFKAGELKNCVNEWEKITSNIFILQCITNLFYNV